MRQIMTKVLHPTALRANGADYLRTYHQVKVGPEITLEDILKPAFWAHHTNVLRPDDLIDILSTDGGLDMQVRVIGKGIGMVMVRPLRVWVREQEEAADESEIDLPAGYIVNFAPKQGWRVMTSDPHMIISKDHKSREEATAIAVAHSRKASGLVA
jgi:hypothetical protein